MMRWLLFVLWGLMACSAHSETQEPEPSKQAQELVALPGKYSIAKTPSDAVNLAQGSSDLFVDQVVTELGKGNSKWHKDDPAWKKLKSTIREDVANYQQKLLNQVGALNAQLNQKLALAYDEELDSAGVEYLLNFYSSPLGQNYLNFSTSSDKIMASCVPILERMKMNGEHLSPPSTKEDSDAWGKRIELLSKAFAPRVVDRARNIGAIQHWGNVAMGCALIKGKEVDKIGKKIELDLPEIDSYIANEYSEKELTLLYSVATRFMGPLVTDYQSWLKNKQETWKRTYDDLTH